MKHVHKIIFEKMCVPFKAEDIFPLLCPVREYDWIANWKCDLIHSESGLAELGCVFQTEVDGAQEKEKSIDTWIIAEYTIPSRIVFTRTNGLRSCLYSIELQQTGSETSLVWQQELVGLSAEGNMQVESTTQSEFSLMVQNIEKALTHYLRTGNCLKDVD